ncbi:MAG: hypothetical protein JWO58_1884 [Chitinophagaceae bacterium]|nr:hypothetical protein [Chitinophagaceae bacterium]
MEYGKIYRELHPVLKKKLRRRKLLCVLWAMLGALLFFFGGWFFAIVPFVILVTDFVFKNNINKKGLTLIRAKVLNKVEGSSTHSSIEKDATCLSKYCFELDIYEAHFFSCIGKVKDNHLLHGIKTIKVGENLFASFERDTEVMLVVLSNKKCVGYLLNGELMVA